MKYSLGDAWVKTAGDDYWIAPNAIVVGDVTLGQNASIWWNCVVRGDFDTITIGENTNIQDGSVLHVDYNKSMNIGNNITVGHMAMLHGCTVGDGSLIGIGSIVMNRAVIGKNCLIGANTLVPEDREIPDGSLVLGSPGKVIRKLDAEEIARIQFGVGEYVKNWKRFKRDLALQD
ncbi:MAG: gamma carbonic anhydrase family protein [Rhodospirillales bacterium]|jgi:carbonic anhydrase/acetyltransferase-like protein (isoleucine patch superfamily)|nr:gamma carbonic anhydrase family protein [Rhodospirillales bacterium]